jgi:histidinol-phosphate aminotransferase
MLAGTNKTLPAPTTLLHSNENAFGPSPHAKRAFRAAAHDVERYIEDSHGFLAPHLSARYGPQPDQIVIGQGSDDILARLGRVYLGPGTELVRFEAGYQKVPNYAHANDAEVVSVAGNGLTTSVEALLGAVTPRTRVVYVANPENPAGTYLTAAELQRLHAGLPGDVLLVIDAAYEEYVDVEDACAAHGSFANAANVVVCRTFSKVFGLAGGRVGWATGDAKTLDPVRRIGLTFPISTPALHAAVAALADTEHQEWVAGETIRLRRWLAGELTRMGLDPVQSQANFVLVRFADRAHSAKAASDALAEEGILIRRFASPLFEDYARITIGRESELRRALDAVRRFVESPGT